MSSAYIYPICLQDNGKETQIKDYYKPLKKDQAGGFIPMSLAHRINGKVEKFFRDKKDFCLFKISFKEPELYIKLSTTRRQNPQFYEKVEISKVIERFPLPLDQEGFALFIRANDE